MTTAQTITGRFQATIRNVKCELELYLDHTGCVTGSFTTDGERLEVMGGVPTAFGQVFGLIRAPGGDTLAVFRAVPQARNLVLEVNTPGLKLLEAQRVSFQRLRVDQAGSPQGVDRGEQDRTARAQVFFDLLLTRTNPS